MADKDGDDDDDEIIRPNSAIDIAESDPGKVVDRDTGAIRHVDVENAVYVAALGWVADRARDIGETLQDEIREQAESDSNEIYMSPRAVSVPVIELHTLTFTYFEGVAYKFLDWAQKVDNDLVEEFRSKNFRKVPEEGTFREWDEKTQRQVTEGMSSSNLINWLANAGILENDSPLHDVKKRRNRYVHDPTSAFGVKTSHYSNKGKEVFEGEVIIDLLVDCMDAIDETEAMIDNHLPVDEHIYESISEK